MEESMEKQIVMPAETDLAPLETASPNRKGGRARMQSLSSDQKKKLGRKAANARWGKSRTAAASPLASSASKATNSTRKNRSRSKENRVFGFALTAAEKRLAKAIEERARSASVWAVLNAEIPSLQRTIAALRNQQTGGAPAPGYEMPLPDGTVPGYPASFAPANYDLARVVSDAPVPAQRPLAASRAGGGAIGINLGDADDENQFLDSSSVASGQWH
jgi:hypothetical protein